MSDNDKKEDTGCCKGFNDEACPCLDKETGERNCGPKEDKAGCGTDKGCCGPKQGCCPK